MFSGIVETQARVLKAQADRGLIFIDVERPLDFNDIKIGDSICHNGVCLTVESFDAGKMTFALGAETLKVTGWNVENLTDARLNLERSLSLGDRIHGHMVSGHVDGVGEVVSVQDLGGSVQVDVRAPKHLLRSVWKKGGWAVNGVSLTVNDIQGDVVSQCLIPETLRRTNLGQIQVGAKVNLEIDMMARGIVQFLEAGIESGALLQLVQELQRAPTSSRQGPIPVAAPNMATSAAQDKMLHASVSSTNTSALNGAGPNESGTPAARNSK